MRQRYQARLEPSDIRARGVRSEILLSDIFHLHRYTTMLEFFLVLKPKRLAYSTRRESQASEQYGNVADRHDGTAEL